MEPTGGLEVDLSPEEMKEAEREVIQRQIEATEAQLEAMEKMEEEGGGDMLDDATVQALKVNTIDQDFFQLFCARKNPQFYVERIELCG